MQILKNEIARYLALGFAGGAALVLGTMSIDPATTIASGIVPPAQAAAAK